MIASTRLARLAAASLWVCLGSLATADGPLEFRNVTEQTGIAFQHTDGHAGGYNIVEYVASGLATFDYDGDGLVDIYFSTAPRWSGSAKSPTPGCRLYRNLGQWKFLGT